MLLGAACCLISAATLWSGSAAAKPVGEVENIDVHCEVRGIVAGPDGNVWFTCERDDIPPHFVPESIVGRVTPQGEVQEFSQGLSPLSFLPEIIAGPDGNLWFPIEPGLNQFPPKAALAGIGRVTPQGQITEFRAGLGGEDQPARPCRRAARERLVQRQPELRRAAGRSPAGNRADHAAGRNRAVPRRPLRQGRGRAGGRTRRKPLVRRRRGDDRPDHAGRGDHRVRLSHALGIPLPFSPSPGRTGTSASSSRAAVTRQWHGCRRLARSPNSAPPNSTAWASAR